MLKVYSYVYSFNCWRSDNDQYNPIGSNWCFLIVPTCGTVAAVWYPPPLGIDWLMTTRSCQHVFLPVPKRIENNNRKEVSTAMTGEGGTGPTSLGKWRHRIWVTEVMEILSGSERISCTYQPSPEFKEWIQWVTWFCSVTTTSVGHESGAVTSGFLSGVRRRWGERSSP